MPTGSAWRSPRSSPLRAPHRSSLILKTPAEENFFFVETNVTQPASLTNLVDQVVAKYGHIDVLVANAGITEHKGPVFQLDEEN
ncbi:SDR family NAD(P)-dependent oxidoreductase [Limosilactobacillus fermentum]|uniref:SDR family NAD(P)-dependent oxidoreductase n=1 Tax=Limosilactobacillus fermentum TaxID=1613 RepID=UPI002F26DA44